jgi:hypothetical protein
MFFHQLGYWESALSLKLLLAFFNEKRENNQDYLPFINAFQIQ